MLLVRLKLNVCELLFRNSGVKVMNSTTLVQDNIQNFQTGFVCLCMRVLTPVDFICVLFRQFSPNVLIGSKIAYVLNKKYFIPAHTCARKKNVPHRQQRVFY